MNLKLLAFPIVPLILSYYGAYADGPVCKVDSVLADVGTANVGESISHRFSIANEGTQNLTIELQSKSCGCVSTTIPKAIKPGASDVIELKARAGNQPAGEFLASFRTNDPKLPLLVLKLAYKGSRRITAQPASINVGIVTLGSTGNATIDIQSSTGDTPFQVLSVKLSSKNVSVTCAEPIPTEPKSKHSITLALSYGREGRINGSVTVQTDDPKTPVVEIPVRGTVEGPYIFEPSELRFGVVKPEDNRSVACELKSRDGLPFQVQVNTANSDRLEIEATPVVEFVQDGNGVKSSKVWKIVATTTGVGKPGVWREECKVDVMNDKGDKLSVSVPAVGTLLGDF